MIRADETGQSIFRMARMEIPYRVDGVGCPAAPEFLFINGAACSAVKSQPKKIDARAITGRPVFGLEGRLGDRDEEKSVQLQFRQRGVSEHQMTVVNGIKSAAENADTYHS
tara:strand:- start:24 stop:356 length:333 start_codon:yes stop_codon:yes gene_type:complete